MKSQAFAEGLKWAARFPAPFGLGLPPDLVTAITPEDIARLEDDRDCVINHAFDPHDALSALGRVAPRRITFVLLRNELRFVGERFLRMRGLVPGHPAHTSFLTPIIEQVERLTPAKAVSRGTTAATLASDSEFRVLMRMFEGELCAADYGTVLMDGETQDGDLRTEVSASLFRLEGDNVVLLETSARVTYVRCDDTIACGRADAVEPGDRLIVISPEAREFIASRVLSARREEERDGPADRAIRRWQGELAAGIERLGIGNSELLRRIRERGSQRSTSGVIRQWAAGEVLGPLDPHDIRRIAEVIESEWLLKNWQSVGSALFAVRTLSRHPGHPASIHSRLCSRPSPSPTER